MENNTDKKYIAIDLKSFYAAVECILRGYDPLNTNLVVADASRTEKTICLAVSPSLKNYGIPGRARLFEVGQRMKEVNAIRKNNAPYKKFTGKSFIDSELKQNRQLEADYIAAPPQMAVYMDYSTKIYNIYMKYIAPEDIHVYSIDEVFMDVTNYLNTYNMTARELTLKIMKDVLETTGMTATAGIGTNLYLCKVAMDIVAKNMSPDEDGARIAELDEISYRKKLWNYRPVTDFWRVGKGYASKLEKYGIYTMGDIALCSVGNENDYYNEDLLYKLFGVNAELLIDHAWGYEPCTIQQIKAYRPENNSISSGQVLSCPYDSDKARIIIHEMTELLVLDLVEKRLVTNQMVLTVGYDIENISDTGGKNVYRGELTTDFYGRKIPKHAHGTVNLDEYTSSTKLITKAVLELYDNIINKKLTIRRINLVANHVINEGELKYDMKFEQMSLFTDYEQLEKERAEKKKDLEKERKMQEAMISIKKKFGKNAILKGTNFEEGATARQRNKQIGGHNA